MGTIVACILVDTPCAAEPARPKEQVVYSFCSQRNCADGRGPGSLTYAGGLVFGVTIGGGVNCSRGPCGNGTTFMLDPKSGALKVLHEFCSLQGCVDGAGPTGSLVEAGGILYGTTIYGGLTGCEIIGCGTAYSLELNSGVERVLHTFAGGADGELPSAGLLYLGAKMYGTTTAGGGGAYCTRYNGCGTIFSLDPKSGAEAVVYSFCSQINCTDGASPSAGLIDLGGVLYGTTELGGSGGCQSGCGTVFSLDPASGAETVAYSFAGGTDGEGPSDSLIYLNGLLYGTTYSGGSSECSASCGTVFSLDPATGSETVLYAFCSHQSSTCTDGRWPTAGLLAEKGTLYGATRFGGSHFSGSVFAFDLKTGAERVVYSFCDQTHCPDGSTPGTNLIDVGGRLYGTTQDGGANCQPEGGCGTVFVLRK